MELLDNYIRNHKEIVDYCLSVPDKFFPREGADGHGGNLPFKSRFSTFKSDDMDDSFIDTIFKDSDFDDDMRDMFFFIQIQRYNPGEYIVPHRDNYNITKLHLVTLTSSESDGLVYQSEPDKLIKIYDKAGTKIDADMNNWHWVDPVKDVRFSLVVTE